MTAKEVQTQEDGQTNPFQFTETTGFDEPSTSRLTADALHSYALLQNPHFLQQFAQGRDALTGDAFYMGAGDHPGTTSGDEESVTGSESDIGGLAGSASLSSMAQLPYAAYFAQFASTAAEAASLASLAAPSFNTPTKRKSGKESSATSKKSKSSKHTRGDSTSPETQPDKDSLTSTTNPDSHHPTPTDCTTTPSTTTSSLTPAQAQALRRATATRTSTKRAEQNRAAQRAFRERRQRYIKDLELRAEASTHLSAQVLETTARLAELQHTLESLIADRDAWTRERAEWWREREEAVRIATRMARELEGVQGENKRLRDAVWGVWNSGEKGPGVCAVVREVQDLFEAKIVGDLTRDVVVVGEEDEEEEGEGIAGVGSVDGGVAAGMVGDAAAGADVTGGEEGTDMTTTTTMETLDVTTLNTDDMTDSASTSPTSTPLLNLNRLLSRSASASSITTTTSSSMEPRGMVGSISDIGYHHHWNTHPLKEAGTSLFGAQPTLRGKFGSSGAGMGEGGQDVE
ncbi:hypothetical protein HDV00_007049 [Rhizophlyctis rosea]|nr:hypothetical protein HDV00_007049 [Rhizophlyctis rosea]